VIVNAVMETDLASYQLQLEQVQAALNADPGNAALVHLESDLKHIISLTEDIARTRAAPKGRSANQWNKGGDTVTAASPATSAERLSISVGDVVQVLYEKDTKWYDAVVHDVDAVHARYTITFAGYGTTELVGAERVRVKRDDTQEEILAAAKAAINRNLSDREKALIKKKKVKREKYKEKQEQWDEDSRFRADSWQSFKNKAAKSTRPSLDLSKKSIFATSEGQSTEVSRVLTQPTMTPSDIRRMRSRGP
jgi:hypothetical protein